MTQMASVHNIHSAVGIRLMTDESTNSSLRSGFLASRAKWRAEREAKMHAEKSIGHAEEPGRSVFFLFVVVFSFAFEVNQLFLSY
jgi:hypothetical protein